MLGDDFRFYPEEHSYFVDFMREAPEPTGDEEADADLSVPKVYEIVPR